MSDAERIVQAHSNMATNPSITYRLQSFDHFIGIDGSRVKLFVQLEERGGCGHLHGTREIEVKNQQ